jgi:hypothetical protein
MPNTAYAPFPIDEHLTQIALAYKNQRMIADEVLPRIPVDKQLFKWMKFDKAERFTQAPNTLVGRKSIPNEVEFGAEEDTAATRDYGLDDIIPNADLANADSRFNPTTHAVEVMSDLIMLGREKRVADLVFNPDTYPSGRKEAVTTNFKWGKADYNPIPKLLEYLDTPIMRPNIIVMGQAAWTTLRTNPAVVKAVQGNSGDAGAATKAALADLLEVEDIIVGQGWINTAKQGAAPTIQRLWGAHAALLYRNPLANNRGGVTFGYTAQWGGRIAGAINEEKVGLRGSVRVRVGESVVEMVAAADVGFLLTDVK